MPRKLILPFLLVLAFSATSGASSNVPSGASKLTKQERFERKVMRERDGRGYRPRFKTRSARHRYAVRVRAARRAVRTKARASSVVTVPAGGNITTAYNQAQAGDTVQLSCGSYSRWITPSGVKVVTVKGGANLCTKLPNIDVHAANLTLDGLNLDAGGAKAPPLYADGSASNLTVKNSRVGNVKDEKAALITDVTGAVFDNVTFHDAVITSAGEANDVHMECLYSMAPGITIRNSRFENCAIMDILFTRGSWWSPPQPGYGNITLTNNFFGASRRTNGTGTHFYSVYFGDIGATWRQGVQGSGTVNGITVRGNTIEGPTSMVAPESRVTNSVESCNTGGMDLPGIVHETCGTPPPPPPPPAPACSDGIDNDGDGRIDFPADLGCASTTDDSESPDPTPPPPPPAYDPVCRPTCDEQIAQLKSDKAALEQQVATLTAERNQAQALAQSRLDKLQRIGAIVDE